MSEQAIIPIAQADVVIAGYPMIAVLLPDGQSGAILTNLCAALNLKVSTQAHLIRNNPALSEALVLVALESPGGTQITNVLLEWAIALWAAGLQQGRRPPAYRELLLAIQREAGRTIAHQFAKQATSSAQAFPPPPTQAAAPQSVWQEGHLFLDHLQGAVEGLGLEQQNVYNHLAVMQYDLHKQGRRIVALEAGHASPAGGLSDAQLGTSIAARIRPMSGAAIPLTKYLPGWPNTFGSSKFCTCSKRIGPPSLNGLRACWRNENVCVGRAY